jgi:hypothetical protein
MVMPRFRAQQPLLADWAASVVSPFFGQNHFFVCNALTVTGPRLSPIADDIDFGSIA